MLPSLFPSAVASRAVTKPPGMNLMVGVFSHTGTSRKTPNPLRPVPISSMTDTSHKLHILTTEAPEERPIIAAMWRPSGANDTSTAGEFCDVSSWGAERFITLYLQLFH